MNAVHDAKIVELHSSDRLHLKANVSGFVADSSWRIGRHSRYQADDP